MVNQFISLSPNPEYPHYDQTVSDCRGNMGFFKQVLQKTVHLLKHK